MGIQLILPLRRLITLLLLLLLLLLPLPLPLLLLLLLLLLLILVLLLFLLLLPRAIHSTNNKFKLCTLNIQSLLHPTHAAEINDLALSSHPPDLFALTETFLNGYTTLAEYQDCIPSGYNLHSTPRNLKLQATNTTGVRGGIAFLTC